MPASREGLVRAGYAIAPPEQPMDCIFCKIVAGEIPSVKVFEDDDTLVFMDINPLSEGHLLVVPKLHFPNLFEGDDRALGQVIVTARKVAAGMKTTLGIDSLNMIQANGPWAVQSVAHFHIHLIPRRENDGVGLDWQPQPGNLDSIKQVGASIAAALA